MRSRMMTVRWTTYLKPCINWSMMMIMMVLMMMLMILMMMMMIMMIRMMPMMMIMTIHSWTTYLKSRLNCSIPGDYPFYFNHLRESSSPVKLS